MGRLISVALGNALGVGQRLHNQRSHTGIRAAMSKPIGTALGNALGVGQRRGNRCTHASIRKDTHVNCVLRSTHNATS